MRTIEKLTMTVATTVLMTTAVQAQTIALNINADGAHRSSSIHWPTGYSPRQADLFAHNEQTIRADCANVWQHIVAAAKWPQWYPNAQNVRIADSDNGVLQSGSRFTWTTFGLPISSTVHEFVPDRRAGWFDKSKGLDAYHTWLLQPTNGGGCHVVTEEVVKGPAAIALRQSDPNAMHKGHALWLAKLKELAERHS